MIVIHGSSRRLARAIRRAGPFSQLRRGLKRFTTSLFKWNAPAAPVPDWNRDILLAYPDRCNNAPSTYAAMVEFYRANKYIQWQALADFFPCPVVKNAPFVIRPLRHEGGAGFEMSDTLPTGTNGQTRYWRSLWKRTAEYRVFFVRGRPVLTMLKRVPDGTRQDIAWNAAAGVSSFVTVHEEENNRLRHTAFFDKATAFFEKFPFHLCAVDVLYNDCKHRVVEVNFSPGVLIPDNLRIITQSLLNERS